MNTKNLIKKAEKVNSESKQIDFKQEFNPNDTGDWCEIIKDIVAFANSGGGLIIFGVQNDGKKYKFDNKIIISLDTATITDKIEKYTNVSFSDVSIIAIKRKSKKCAVFLIGPSVYPIIFGVQGNYQKNNKQKTAFSKGAVYFRRGSKSQPGTFHELKRIIDNLIKKQQKEILKGMRKVVDVPIDHEVKILPKNIKISETGYPVKIARKGETPTSAALLDPDKTHPNRQKEVLHKLNTKLKLKLNQHDFQCLKKMYKINENEEFFYKSKFGASQYSQALIDWIIERYTSNKNFFKEARDIMKRLR